MPRNWMRDEPEIDAEENATDTRPVLGVCPVCVSAVHGGDEIYEPDEAYCIDDEYVHKDCAITYLDENGYRV